MLFVPTGGLVSTGLVGVLLPLGVGVEGSSPSCAKKIKRTIAPTTHQILLLSELSGPVVEVDLGGGLGCDFLGLGVVLGVDAAVSDLGY